MCIIISVLFLSALSRKFTAEDGITLYDNLYVLSSQSGEVCRFCPFGLLEGTSSVMSLETICLTESYLITIFRN